MEKEELFRKLNIDINEMICSYKKTALLPLEFSTFLIHSGARIMVKAHGNTYNVGRAIDEAVKHGITAGITDNKRDGVVHDQ